MTFPQVNNSDVFCCVVNGNQVGVAMQRLASVDSIRPRNAGGTQIVAAVNCADAGKVWRNSYNCNTANQLISQGQDWRLSQQHNHEISDVKHNIRVHHYVHDIISEDAPRRCGDDHVTKSRNRKLIRVTSSNKGLKQMCVDLSDYNIYLNQIWYRTQIQAWNICASTFKSVNRQL